MSFWHRLLFVGLAVGVVIGVGWGIKNQLSEDDFRIGLLTDKELGLVSISRQRKMVSLLIIPEKTSVWIPFGPGNYEVNKVKKLFELKQNESDKKMVFLYNWGFLPDTVVELENINDWEKLTYWKQRWGWFNWLRYRLNQTDWWYKTDKLKGEVVASNEEMVDILSRDFADAGVLDDLINITVYNDSEKTGLAGFMANILDWSGMSVVGVETGGRRDRVETCKLFLGKKADSTRSARLLKKMFRECEAETLQNLGEDRVEVHVGEKFAQMLNYESFINN